MRAGEECHYCGEPATTRDHIVPRSRLDPTRDILRTIPNTVPACYRCNKKKKDGLSDCGCNICRDAWGWYGPRDKNNIPTWRSLPVTLHARRWFATP